MFMVGGIEGVWEGLESRDTLSVYIVWSLLAWIYRIQGSLTSS